MDVGAAVLQRKSGLFVPAGTETVAKRTRVMARKKFLRILKQMRWMRNDHGLVACYSCVTCHGAVKLSRGSAIIQTDAGDNTVDPRKDTFSLSCLCTVWTVNK